MLYLEVVQEPHPLFPPLLERRGGRADSEGAKPLQTTLLGQLDRDCLKGEGLVNSFIFGGI